MAKYRESPLVLGGEERGEERKGEGRYGDVRVEVKGQREGEVAMGWLGLIEVTECWCLGVVLVSWRRKHVAGRK